MGSRTIVTIHLFLVRTGSILRTQCLELYSTYISTHACRLAQLHAQLFMVVTGNTSDSISHSSTPPVIGLVDHSVVAFPVALTDRIVDTGVSRSYVHAEHRLARNGGEDAQAKEMID